MDDSSFPHYLNFPFQSIFNCPYQKEIPTLLYLNIQPSCRIYMYKLGLVLTAFTHFCPSEFLIDTKCIQWFFIVLYSQHLQTEIFSVVWGQQKMLREQNSTFSTTAWFKLNTLNDWLHHFTLSLPEVCKTEFLLTIWRQYQADKYWE